MAKTIGIGIGGGETGDCHKGSVFLEKKRYLASPAHRSVRTFMKRAAREICDKEHEAVGILSMFWAECKERGFTSCRGDMRDKDSEKLFRIVHLEASS